MSQERNRADTPVLSVIVVVVDGGAQLERCLAALATQRDGPPLEVLVPWDDSLAGMDALAGRHPACRFIPMGRVTTVAPAASHAGLHELYDRRRTIGLHAATGTLVAMIEDRSVPVPSWAAAAARLHRERTNGVIGGALACGRDSVIGRADYLCDFYRFQPPFEAGPRDYVSYVNVCYKRAALERTRAVWEASYYDLAVHAALVRDGEQLWLAPELLVMQQRGDGTRLATLIGERFAWGRRFAARRLQLGGGGRLRYALQSPLVPLLLYLRAARAQRGAAASARLLAATPFMLLIFGAWGFGELVGSLAGDGSAG